MTRALIASSCLVVVFEAFGLWPAVIAATAYLVGYVQAAVTAAEN